MNQHNSRYCVCGKVDNQMQHVCCVCLDSNPDIAIDDDKSVVYHYCTECYELPYAEQLAKRAMVDHRNRIRPVHLIGRHKQG